MNAAIDFTSYTRRSTDAKPSQAHAAKVLPSRREHRARDFGVGYGSSSGYASNRRYTSEWGAPRFRCA